MEHEIIEAKPAALAQTARPSATPGDLVRYALDNGADIERLEKLMAMQIQWEEREAKKAYVAAMAEFKKNAPEIYKSKLVEFSEDDVLTHPVEDQGVIAAFADSLVVVALDGRVVLGKEVLLLLDDPTADPCPVGVE